MEMHPADLTDLIFYWWVKDMDQGDRLRFENEITIPPANVKPDEDDPLWSAEAEMSLFKKNGR